MARSQKQNGRQFALRRLIQINQGLSLILVICSVGVLALGPVFIFYVAPAGQADVLLEMIPRDAAVDRSQFSIEIQEYIRDNTRRLPAIFIWSHFLVVILSGLSLVVGFFSQRRVKNTD